jgi:hypothetical protein
MTIWRMRIACYIPKDTNTHTQHKWLHERASMLRYKHIAGIVCYPKYCLTQLSMSMLRVALFSQC